MFRAGRLGAVEAQGMGRLRTADSWGDTCRDWALCGGAEWIIEYQRMAMGGESWPSREKPGPDRTHAYQGARDFSGLNDLVSGHTSGPNGARI